MCGICGVVGLHAPDSGAAGAVKLMLEKLLHRGPDGDWQVTRGPATFGMSRLTIRGLTSGQQPLIDEASGVMVVCNGEIDNHQELRDWLAERGRPVEQDTDVAVLPGLYLELGEAFVERLIGAFAIAVWDPGSRKVLLFRDRAGERPLFYSHAGGVVRFASQLAALGAGSPKAFDFDQVALNRYLQLGHFPAPESPLRGVCKVAPAERVVIDEQGVSASLYWRWPCSSSIETKADLEKFDEIFREAVHRQSEVDVPVGLFLSGGVDSSLIAAVTRSLHPDKSITAFGLRFAEDSFDEGAFAEQVASELDIDYVPVWVTPEEIPRLLRAVLRTSGEPLADPAWIPTALLSERASREIRLSLSGEGADELFGGYPTYFGAALAERYALLPRWMRGLIRRQVESWPPSDKKVTLSFLLKRFVQGDDLDGVSRHVLWTSTLPPSLLERLGVSPAEGMTWRGGEREPLLNRIQQYDLERSLAEGLLTKADRASMHSALELRAPFLDLSVMEFAATLPAHERVRGIQTKVFLKRYATRYLPKSIVYRKKRGLSVPLSGWLRGPLHTWAVAALSNERLERVGLDRQVAQTLLNEHVEKRADHARALWSLMVVSEWLTALDDA